MRLTITEEHRVEIHEGLMLRLEELKKAKKNCESVGLRAGAREAEEHISVIRGKDDDPGLLSKFVDQTTLDFNAGKSEGGAASDTDDLFEGADRSRGRRKSRATAKPAAEGESPATGEGTAADEPAVDYEIVDDTAPPPRADEVESLVPHS